MHDPTERADADKPEHARPDEEKHGGEKAALQKLPEAGNKKTGQGRDHISRGALASFCHVSNKSRGRTVVDPSKKTYPARKRSKTAVVDRPGTRGRIRISEPAADRAARSSGSRDSGV